MKHTSSMQRAWGLAAACGSSGKGELRRQHCQGVGGQLEEGVQQRVPGGGHPRHTHQPRTPVGPQPPAAAVAQHSLGLRSGCEGGQGRGRCSVIPYSCSLSGCPPPSQPHRRARAASRPGNTHTSAVTAVNPQSRESPSTDGEPPPPPTEGGGIFEPTSSVVSVVLTTRLGAR